MFYDNPAAYIGAAPDVEARINRLTAVIEALETCSLNAASNSDVQQYSFNDGQSQIGTTYRTISDITNAITAFETIRERLINRAAGRATILRDANTLVKRHW